MQPHGHLILSGYVKNNMIFLDKAIQLADNIKVTIIVPETTKKASGLCGIWRDYRSIEEIIKEIITARSVC